MKLILSGTTILAASDNVQTLSDRYSTGDAEYQFGVADALVTVDALPSDYRPGLYQYDGNFVRVPQPATAEAKDAKKAALAAKRYEVEIGGIEIAGAKVKTDRESQASLTGAYTSLQAGLLTGIDWKTEDGWVTLNLATCEAIAQAVASHVQQSFSREKELSALIDAAETVEDLQAIDINSGW